MKSKMSVRAIKAMVAAGSMVLQPESQRRLVWRPEQKDNLLQSIHRGYQQGKPHYIPRVIASVRDGVIRILDGQQRLSTLIDGAFTTSILNYIVYFDYVEVEDFQQEVQIFTALNSGTALSKSEIAKNLASEEVQKSLQTMEESTFWRQVIPSDKHFDRREVITQCILLMQAKSPKIDIGKAEVMEVTPAITLDDLRQVNKITNFITLGIGNKRLQWQKKVHIPCIFRLLAKSNLMEVYSPAQFVGFINAFILGQGTGAEKFSELRQEYQRTTSNGTSNAIMVEARYTALQAAYFANNAIDFRYNKPAKNASTKPATPRTSQKAELEALKAEKEAQSNKLAEQEAIIKAMQEQLAQLIASQPAKPAPAPASKAKSRAKSR